MYTFLSAIIRFAKIFMFIKVTVLFFQHSYDPKSHPMSEITWWIYILIFGMWILSQLPAPEELPKDDEVI